MSQPNNLQSPSRPKPRLFGGSIHKMQIDENETRVLTWPNLYGNKESRCILAISHSRIVEAEYTRPLIQAGKANADFATWVNQAKSKRSSSMPLTQIHLIRKGVEK